MGKEPRRAGLAAESGGAGALVAGRSSGTPAALVEDGRGGGGAFGWAGLEAARGEAMGGGGVRPRRAAVRGEAPGAGVRGQRRRGDDVNGGGGRGGVVGGDDPTVLACRTNLKQWMARKKKIFQKIYRIDGRKGRTPGGQVVGHIMWAEAQLKCYARRRPISF